MVLPGIRKSSLRVINLGNDKQDHDTNCELDTYCKV